MLRLRSKSWKRPRLVLWSDQDVIVNLTERIWSARGRPPGPGGKGKKAAPIYTLLQSTKNLPSFYYCRAAPNRCCLWLGANLGRRAPSVVRLSIGSIRLTLGYPEYYGRTAVFSRFALVCLLLSLLFRCWLALESGPGRWNSTGGRETLYPLYRYRYRCR